MRCRYPVVIFDRQAVSALQFLSGKKDLSSDYARFFAVWCEEYGKRAEAVASASLGLAQVPRNYLAAYAMDDVSLGELIKQKWFQGRVFDLYLWEMGKSW